MCTLVIFTYLYVASINPNFPVSILKLNFTLFFIFTVYLIIMLHVSFILAGFYFFIFISNLLCNVTVSHVNN